MEEKIKEVLEWAREQMETENDSARSRGGHLQTMAMAAGEVYQEVINKLEDVLKSEVK